MNDNQVKVIDPNEEWARVVLWRWQYGELPVPGEATPADKPLDEATGLENMAAALEDNNPVNYPTVFNVVSVLKYMASRIRKLEGRE